MATNQSYGIPRRMPFVMSLWDTPNVFCLVRTTQRSTSGPPTKWGRMCNYMARPQQPSNACSLRFSCHSG